MRRLRWALPLTLYAILLWRAPYSLKFLPLRVLDWLVPAVGLGTWAVLGWRQRKPWPRTALDGPLLAWCLVTTLAATVSVNLRASLQGAWEMWLWALILWLLVGALRQGWGGALWQALCLTGGAVAVLAAIEFLSWYFGWPLLRPFQQGWFPIGGLGQPVPPYLYRLTFTSLRPATVLSTFITLLIPPAICSFLSTRERDTRLGVVLWLIAAGAMLLLSLSRGGFLALGVSLPFILWGSTHTPAFRTWWSSSSRRSLRLILAAALTMMLLVAVAAGIVMAARLASHQSGDAVRSDLWRSAFEMFRRYPLTGVGPTAFATALHRYRGALLAREHIFHAHSLLLNTGAEMGLLGLVAGAWLLLTLAWAWWRRWRTETPGRASWWRHLGVGGALAGLAAQSLADTFTDPTVLVVATFFTAQILAPDTARQARAGRAKPWPWIAALSILVVGVLGRGWDDWGYAHFVQSQARAGQGDQDGALSAVEKARSHDPWMPVYACHAGYLYGLQAAQGDVEALTTALERYEECTTEGLVAGWLDQLNLATLLWQAGEEAEALTLVREVTGHTPLEWLPWLSRGLWAERAGEQGEAVSAYGWVLSLAPELAGSPFWAQVERRDWWDGIVAAGELANAERGMQGPTWRWQVTVSAGQAETAVQEIRSWLETHPDDSGAMALLGEALLAVERPEDAVVWLDRAVARAPSRARTYLVRGEASLALGRYEKAKRDLQTALFLEPNDRAHLSLARLAEINGDRETALREYSLAQRRYVVFQNSDQVVYRRMTRPDLLPQVIRIGSRQDADVALEWGTLLEEKGDLEAAQRVYHSALALDPFLERVAQKILK